MGTDGGRFDVSDRLTADRLNRKTVFVGTGVEISAITTYPGMLAYCTASGSGLATDTLYERNSANSGWNAIVFEGNTQTLVNKTINSADNSITSTGQNAGDLLVNNGSKYARKVRGSAHEVPQMNSAGTDIEFGKLDPENLTAITQFNKLTNVSGSVDSDAIGTNTYADITNGSVTITAKGNKTALITHFVGTVKLHRDIDNDSDGDIAITDSSNNVLTSIHYFTHGSNTYPVYDNIAVPFSIMHIEAAPSAGSLTRKLRAKANTGGTTITLSGEMYVMEVA